MAKEKSRAQASGDEATESGDMDTIAYEEKNRGEDEPIPFGVVPDLEVLPKKMHAWVIRKERHGDPSKSFQNEIMPVPEIGDNEVLVLVMAACVNYNGVWAGLGEPLSVLGIHKQDYHIAGSDASGIVWRVGSNVKSWKPGDEVILHCNIESETHSSRTETASDFITYDPMASASQKIWGYETPVVPAQITIRPNLLHTNTLMGKVASPTCSKTTLGFFLSPIISQIARPNVFISLNLFALSSGVSPCLYIRFGKSFLLITPFAPRSMHNSAFSLEDTTAIASAPIILQI